MKLQIKVGGAELFRFNLRHTYRSVTGMIGLALSVGALVLAAVTWGSTEGYQTALLLCIGLYYTVLHPWMLRSRSYATAKNQPMFQEPMNYEFQEDSFTVEQGEAKASYLWDDVMKVVDTKKDFILYMDKVHAHILPKDQMEGRDKELGDFLRKNLPAGKIR